MLRTILILAVITMDARLPDFDKLWNFHDPAATEVKFRELLPAAERSGDASYQAQLLTQIARAEGLQAKFDQANATLDQVEKLLTQDLALGRVRYLLERGRVLNSSGQPRQAKPVFEQAWALGSAEHFDFYAIDAAHMMAIVEPAAAAQQRWNERALEVAERSADDLARGWRASLYNNLGWTYFEQKEYEKALTVFEKAVKLREENGKPRELRIARYCVAKTLRVQGKIADATATNRELIRQAEDAGEPDGYFFEELAECLLAAGKSAEARPAFSRAWDVLSKDRWLARSEPARLERLKRLSD
jgi:tetratricopeptide (TPR) repeat protein